MEDKYNTHFYILFRGNNKEVSIKYIYQFLIFVCIYNNDIKFNYA